MKIILPCGIFTNKGRLTKWGVVVITTVYEEYVFLISDEHTSSWIYTISLEQLNTILKLIEINNYGK